MFATVGLVALVFSIIEAPDAGWLSARTLGGIAAGLASARSASSSSSCRQRHPLLDPRLFPNRKLVGRQPVDRIQFFAFFGFTFVSLQYLQGVRGYSPLIAALAVLPLSGSMMPTARVTPGLVNRFGARAVCVTGLVLVAAGLAIISRDRDRHALLADAGRARSARHWHGRRHDARHDSHHRGTAAGAAGCRLRTERPLPGGRRRARHRGHRQHRHRRLPLQPAAPRRPRRAHGQGASRPSLSPSTWAVRSARTPAPRLSTASTPGSSTPPAPRSSRPSASPSCCPAAGTPASPSTRPMRLSIPGWRTPRGKSSIHCLGVLSRGISPRDNTPSWSVPVGTAAAD